MQRRDQKIPRFAASLVLIVLVIGFSCQSWGKDSEIKIIKLGHKNPILLRINEDYFGIVPKKDGHRNIVIFTVDIDNLGPSRGGLFSQSSRNLSVAIRPAAERTLDFLMNWREKYLAYLSYNKKFKIFKGNGKINLPISNKKRVYKEYKNGNLSTFIVCLNKEICEIYFK